CVGVLVAGVDLVIVVFAEVGPDLVCKLTTLASRVASILRAAAAKCIDYIDCYGAQGRRLRRGVASHLKADFIIQRADRRAFRNLKVELAPFAVGSALREVESADALVRRFGFGVAEVEVHLI